MTQNPAASTSVKAAPTSADACMSIVHSLMHYRQGVDDRGESEQFSRRAIESLVKKLKEKPEALDSLITAITTNGSHHTKCVTIPRTLDGRLQVAGRKCFPHVIYARIWRWPDLHKNELRRAEGCNFAFDLKADSVCVNPYHYVRDVSLGVDLSALTLHQVKTEHMTDGQWIPQSHDPESFRYGYNNVDNNYGTVPENYTTPIIDNHAVGFDYQMRPNIHTPAALAPHPGPGLLMETVASPLVPPQQTPHHSVETGVANEAADIKGMDNSKYANGPHQVRNFVNKNLQQPAVQHHPQQLHPPQQPQQLHPSQQPQQSVTPAMPGHSEWPAVKRGTLDYTINSNGAQNNRLNDNTGTFLDPRSPMSHSGSPMPMQQFPLTGWRHSDANRNNFEPISKLPLPQYWCSITYYELDVQVGEIFKVPHRYKLVGVDGYVEQNDKERFCLGALSNVHRTDISERARLHIGRGIKLELIGEGDVLLSCVSEHSIFVQSHYLDWAAGKAPGEVVHKMHKGAQFKVFDLKQFYHEMKSQANANGIGGGAGVHGGHLAPAISHATAASGIGIDDLRRLCILRLSFVKGWGADYNRKTIKETPCWIEIQLHRALQVLDEVLLHTIPTESANKRQVMLSC